MISNLHVSGGRPTQLVLESRENDNDSINFSQSGAKSFRSETIGGNLVVKIENANTIMVGGQQAGKNGARSGNVCAKPSAIEARFGDPGGTWTDTRDCNTEGPDSSQIWTGSGDSSKIEWDPNRIWTGLRGSRARDEVRRAGLGEIAPDLEDPRRKGRFDCELWSEGERRSRAATFGAGLTISGTAEAGLGNLAAVWTGTHDSGDVEAVSSRYSSDPLYSGDIMARTWKFGSKPRVGGAEFRNSSQMRVGSRVSGVGRSDSCMIGSGLRNSNIIGPTSGTIGVGPTNFSKSGTNFNKICNGSSNFGPNWTGSGNSSTPGAGDGELDFIGVGLGHSANGRSDISEFVTPKTKISMFLGLNNGSNGLSITLMWHLFRLGLSPLKLALQGLRCPSTF
ncbi:hypothetical protein L484_009293 [Morus notabilis]|uniref:Uncharacterized protein n=1 Tax=Morus notabilis TaxID=981085 RepID=W9R978_9ROSA|nr:hypothetical protein L484_009293 [Morus notabilis]